MSYANIIGRNKENADQPSDKAHALQAEPYAHIPHQKTRPHRPYDIAQHSLQALAS